MDADPRIPKASPHPASWEEKAEILVLYKLVAGRLRDISDIEGIVRRQGRRLDVERIRRCGLLFGELKEEPDLLAPFETALARAR